MKRRISLYLSFFFLFSCTLNIKRLSDGSEIEDMLLSLSNSKYSYLIKYLSRNPVRVELNPDSTIECAVINRDRKVLLVPRKAYKSFNLRTAYLAKSLYEYMIRTKYEIYDDIPLEAKLLSSYFEIEFILNHLSADVISEVKNTQLGRKICFYVMDEVGFEKIVKDEEYVFDKTCSRPSFELNYYKQLSDKLRRSLDNIYSDNFFRVMYELEMNKAKRGHTTYYDAWRNYYYISSEPEMELYRDMRKNIYFKTRSLDSFSAFYKREIKKLRKNRLNSKSLLSDLTFCFEIK
ncbi:MAG: hypothetical protein ACP5PA_06265 [Elusimicrobiales bacterium]